MRQRIKTSRTLRQKYDLRVEGCIGPESQDGTEMTVRGRISRYNKEDGSVEHESDPRHAELMIREMGLENAKSVTTPSTGSRDPKVTASNCRKRTRRDTGASPCEACILHKTEETLQKRSSVLQGECKHLAQKTRKP